MTDACSSIRSRSGVSYEGDIDDAQCEAKVDDERAAEAKRNAYYANGGDEGGQCRRASSDARAYEPYTPDQPHVKDAQQTSKLDPPCQDDRWGNALLGGLAGGAIKGAMMALPSLGGIALKALAGAATKEGIAFARSTAKVGPPDGALEGSAPAATSAPGGSAPASPSPAGMSGPNATSSVAEDPGPAMSVQPYLVLPM